jgi:rhodanese-related sulfurtransferase
MYKKLLLIGLVFALGLFAITGCDGDKSTKPTPVSEFEMIAETVTNYLTTYVTGTGRGVNVSIQAVFDLLTDGNATNDPVILDYRAADAFASGHITGAVNIALGDLVAKIEDGTIAKDKAILNVCYTGQTASAATALLNMLGFDAQNLSFGMCAVDTSILGTDKWLAQIAADEHAADLTAVPSTATQTYEFPTLSTGEESAEDIIMANFQPSTWTIAANDVWDNRANYFIVNYWPADKYVNPGHIPGAYQFTPNQSLQTTEQLNLLPTDKTVVVYCYTGQTSAQVATALRILGYDAKSLLYGNNGFAYGTYTSARYAAPAPGTYDAILVK